jgi:hypothetical protein
MNKKALLLFSHAMAVENLTIAEELSDQGYDLYTNGQTALLLNQNMIPTNTFFENSGITFDCVVQA